MTKNVFVLISGDQVSRRGALTGGYYDSRQSRLDCQRHIVKIKNDIEDMREKHTRVREQLESILLTR